MMNKNKPELTESQHKALKWLRERQRGYIDNHGYVCAQGERGNAFAPETWLRLFVKGYLFSTDNVHIEVGFKGVTYLRENADDK